MTATSMPWVKLYTEMLDDPKVGKIADDLKWRFVQLILYAGELDNDGLLPEDLGDIAWRLRIDLAVLSHDLDKLCEHKLVHKEDNRFCITAFSKRQGRTQAEKREQWREAQQRKRENDSEDDAETDEKVPPEGVINDTDMSHTSREDKDSDKDQDADKELKELAGKPARAPAKPKSTRDDNLKITKHPEMKAVARELAIAYGGYEPKRKPPDYFQTPQQLDLYLDAYHALGREWDMLVKKGLALGRISLDDLLAFLQGCVKTKNSNNGHKPPAAAPPHQPADYALPDDDDELVDGDYPLETPPKPSEGEKTWRNFLSYGANISDSLAKELGRMPAELCGGCLVVHAGARAEWCKERVGKSLERYIAGVPGIAGVEWRQS